MKVELSTILQYGDAGVNMAESRVAPDCRGGTDAYLRESGGKSGEHPGV